MKFSIITPVYNSFYLMEQYFHSLENQTLKDFEIILIDDCSTDDSYLSIKGFAENSNLDIKILQTPENMGPGYARNLGLDKSSGDWVTFVDNDDWVELNWLEKVNEIISNNGFDCVIHDYYLKGDRERQPMQTMIRGDEGIISKSEGITFISNHTWGKFYSLSKLKEKNVHFPNTRRCEDVAFTCLALDACDSIYYLKHNLYYYFQRKNSLSNNRNMDEKDMVHAFSFLRNNLEKKYTKEINEKSVRDLLYGGLLMMCKARKSNKDIMTYINEYGNKNPEWFKSSSISFLATPKRVFLVCAKYKFISGLRFLSWVHTKLVGM